MSDAKILLSELRKIEREATLPDWTFDNFDEDGCSIYSAHDDVHPDNQVAEPTNYVDALLIVHARNALSTLLEIATAAHGFMQLNATHELIDGEEAFLEWQLRYAEQLALMQKALAKVTE